MNRTNTLQIRTPEGIVFSQLLAGPIPRFLAWGIDFMIIIGATSVVSVIFIMLDVISAGFGQEVGVRVQFALMIGYGIYLEG